MKKIRQYNELLKRENTLSNIGKKSAKGGAFLLGMQIVSALMQILMTCILARKLTPAEFGLLGMVTVFILFVNVFRDLGLSLSTIQKKKISHREVSNLFWCNFMLSVLLSCLLFAFAPVIASFYKEPRLLPIAMVLSLSFILSGISLQHYAILQRRMDFAKISLLNISGVISADLITIVLVLFYQNIWVLVFMYLGKIGFVSLLYFIFCPWKPSWPRRMGKVRNMLNFGIFVTGFDVINYFSRNLDKILIGRFYGAVSLGYYSKSYELILLPIAQLRGPLTAVALPALSALQDQIESYRSYYRSYCNILATMVFPIAGALVLFAHPLVLLLLGKNWLSTVEIFRLLGLVMFVQPMIGILGPLLLSQGKSKRYFWWGVWYSSVIVLSFGIGLWGSLEFFIICYVCANFLVFFPSVWFCTKNTPVRIRDFLEPQLVPFLFVLGGIAVCLLIREIPGWHSGSWFFSIGEFILFGVVNVAQILWLSRRSQLFALFHYFRKPACHQHA